MRETQRNSTLPNKNGSLTTESKSKKKRHRANRCIAYVYVVGVVAQTVMASIDYSPIAPATVFVAVAAAAAAPVDSMCSAPVETLNLPVNLRAATSSASVPSSTDFLSTVFYMNAGKFASFPPNYYSLL